MATIIDISVPLRAGMPVWPDSPGYHLTQFQSMEAGDAWNNSRLDSDVHVGTHIDAPRHFLPKGSTIDALPLEVLIGPAVVVSLPEVEAITRADLERLNLPRGVQRLLFRTRNSRLWTSGETKFRKDFVALTADAAAWIVDRQIRLVGIDYLSIQRFDDSPETHRILLENAVVILEGLNLSRVEPGPYELICLPLNLVGAEGAPARAVLRFQAKPNELENM